MIRAVVIDDSAYNRVTLSRMLESDPDVTVVATAINGEDGIKQVIRHKPDIITLDLEMPIMDGFAFLRWLMAYQATPVIVVSSRSSDRSVFKALELGAVDFIAKPGGRVSPRLEEIQRDLLTKVRQCTAIALDNLRRRIDEGEERHEETGKVEGQLTRAFDLVVLGASTGGPPALQTVFQNVPILPVPFVIAQHMPPTFTKLFAERVDRLSAYRVKEAEDGETLMPGVAYVAPGGSQTEIERNGEYLQIRVTDRREGDLYAPSVDRLFRSASRACGERVLAVVLTGMGDDGAEAIRELHERGARTIAESSETAIIFGMPGEAIRTGAIDEVLPLPKIASAIQRLFFV